MTQALEQDHQPIGGFLKRFSALVLFLPAALLAASVTYTARFSESELRFTRADQGDVVEHARGHLVPDVGRPALPVVNVVLAVPADARVTGVTVTPEASVELPGTFDVMPARQPAPLSSQPPAPSPKEQEVYGSDAPYPAEVLRHSGTGRAAGFRLASVTLSPLQYRPRSGRLTLHTRLKVVVSFDHAADAAVLTPSQLDRSRASLLALVANPEDLARFSPAAAESDLPEVTLLVVTADRLVSDLQPFIEYKTARGFRAETRTTEWAGRNYPGRDVQEKLRNMIRDFYEHRGTGFVLLAGDNAEVPCRRIRVNVFDEEGDIPTDLYYGDLDFSWDSNHNNLFGEMDDSVDLYADVWVGRASVQNRTAVEALLDKVRTFETDPAPDYIKRSLLPSGWLWRSIGYHGRFMNDSIKNITPPGWVDRELIGPASARVVADSFEHGFAIFDPAGHGNASGVYCEIGSAIYTTGVAGSQHNDRRFSISTSLACNPGDFEWEDCLAEVSHNCPDGGSIAVMMNSRYGWGTPPHIGPSELLCIRFYDFMLSRRMANMAQCHDRSREEYAPSARYSDLWRWCMTEFNLFSDPTLDIWTEVPTRLAIEAPGTISTGPETL
ncbi:hypothetical protein FJY71_06610, partial [candidate division WOR-3 bacterium]|nr:hypothetical protein [candidate division WOR-3 bacterium]